MFGQKLQQLRVKAGLTQFELARKAGVSIDTLQDWEVHGAEPGFGALAKLAGVLGVPQEALATGIDESQQIRDKQVVSARRQRPVGSETEIG